MPDRHPDTHFDPRFLKALRQAVRPHQPVRPWWGWLLVIVVGCLILGVLLVICGLLGIATIHFPIIPATGAVLFAAVLSAAPNEETTRSSFIKALAQYPAEARHVNHWIWHRVRSTLLLFPGITLACGLISIPSIPEPAAAVLGAALASGVTASAVYAVLHCFRAGRLFRRILIAAILAIAIVHSTNLLSPAQLANTALTFNPVAWPLVWLNHGQHPAVGGGQVLLGLAVSLGVIAFVRLTFSRFTARYAARLASAHPVPPGNAGRTYHIRIPAFLASAKTTAPGFWERFIESRRSPRERALAEIASIAGAPGLGRLAVRIVLLMAATTGVAALLFLVRQDGLALLTVIAGVIAMAKKLFASPSADGFPFRALTTGQLFSGGQTILIAGLLPVPWKTLGKLWLKGLLARCALFALLLLPPAILMEIMVHCSWQMPVAGFPGLTLAALLVIGSGIFNVLGFTAHLAKQSGRLRSHFATGVTFLAMGLLITFGHLAILAAFPLILGAWSRSIGSPALGVLSLLLALLSTAGAWHIMLRLLDGGDIDLCTSPLHPRRL